MYIILTLLEVEIQYTKVFIKTRLSSYEDLPLTLWTPEVGNQMKILLTDILHEPVYY